jgi:hypothetical protein
MTNRIATLKTERLQVPLDIGLRREIERAAREQDTSLSQIMRTALRDWQTRRQVERAQREGKAR